MCVLLWSFYSSPGLSVHAPSAFFSLFFFKLFIFFPRIPGGCLAFAGLREHRVPIASEKGFGWPRRTPERPQNLWKHHQRLQVGYICSLEVILLFCYLPWPEEPLTWGMLYKRSVQFAANYRVSLPDQSGRPQQSWHPLTSLVWSYSHWEPDDSSKVCVCVRVRMHAQQGSSWVRALSTAPEVLPQFSGWSWAAGGLLCGCAQKCLTVFPYITLSLGLLLLLWLSKISRLNIT